MRFLIEKMLEIPSSDVNAVASRFPGVWGICLAGGRSSRMGRDKALLPHPSGNTLLSHTLLLLQSLLAPVYISCRKAQSYRECATIFDAVENVGPIGGIYTSLKMAYAAHARAILCLACDLPLMTVRPLERLLRSHFQSMPMASVFLNPHSKKREMTAAVYSCAAFNFFHAAVIARRYRLSGVLPVNQIQVVETLPEEIMLFKNCNTPEEYVNAFM